MKTSAPSTKPFSEVFEDLSAGNIKTKQGDYLASGKYPIVDQGQDLIGGFSNDQSVLCQAELPVIIFGDHTRIVKYIDFPFGVGADGVKVLRPRIEAHPKYLYYFLCALPIPNTGYNRHFKYLKRSEIPLPPLDEQKRIAAVLDAADALRAKRRAALAKLDTLLQSVFLEMFGDPVTNPMGWEKLRLSEFGYVVTGNTPSRASPQYYGDALEWIKSDNINTPSPYLTEAEEGLSELGITVGRTAPQHSLLVTCIAGSPSCIGNVSIADRLVAFNQQINALVPHTPESTLFLYAHFIVGKTLIQRASTNSMKGMVSKSAFSRVKFINPPAPLQRQFSRIAENIHERLEEQVLAIEHTDALFQSLQQAAFSGK